jgi:hypothetical protein
VWELDVLEDGDEDGETAWQADPQWMERVRQRLHTISGPLAHSRGSVQRLREREGAAILHYARQELLSDHPAPRTADDLVELALLCGRLAESSVLTYELIEQRAAAG